MKKLTIGLIVLFVIMYVLYIFADDVHGARGTATNCLAVTKTLQRCYDTEFDNVCYITSTGIGCVSE